MAKPKKERVDADKSAKMRKSIIPIWQDKVVTRAAKRISDELARMFNDLPITERSEEEAIRRACVQLWLSLAIVRPDFTRVIMEDPEVPELHKFGERANQLIAAREAEFGQLSDEQVEEIKRQLTEEFGSEEDRPNRER